MRTIIKDTKDLKVIYIKIKIIALAQYIINDYKL